MASKATAVDIGSHSIKVLVAQVGKHGVSLLRFGGVPAADGHPSLADAAIPLKDTTCGLAGRDMTLRYSQVPPTPDWQLRNLMDLEIQDLAQQSGGALSADYNLLPIEDDSGSDTVLLALAKDEALETYRADAEGHDLRTNQGLRIADNHNSLKAGERGPTLMEDFIFREKMNHFDNERIPERIVHARGAAAHGYFQAYDNAARYSTAGVFSDPSKKTPALEYLAALS